MREMNGRTAIVTGATDGIGRAVCIEFAKSGMNVVINYHTSGQKAYALEEELRGLGAQALAIKADVSDNHEVENMVARTLDTFKGVYCLVNNAGITEPEFVMETTVEKWERMLAINLTSAFLCSKAVLPYMIENKEGVILNISSICGRNGSLGAGVHYSAAKAGMLGLTKALAQHLAVHHIRVNAIAPAMIATRMITWRNDDQMKNVIDAIPLHRLGTAEEVAALAHYLVSDTSSFITGATVDINGGLYMD